MLTPKEKKQLTRYEEDLAMPKWKYILFYGLAFGILMVIITSLTDVFFNEITVSEIFRKRLWINLATVPFAGFFYGLLMRWLMVKQYRKLKGKESAS